MLVRRLLRPVGFAVVLAGLVVLAFGGGALLRATLGSSPAVASAEGGMDAATVANRAATIDGAAVGEVLVNDEVVMRLRATLGGLSPGERAMVVASRLLAWINDPEHYELSVLEMSGSMATINAGASSIVTVGVDDAAPINSTALSLANDWRNNINIVLGLQLAPSEVTEIVEVTTPAEGTAPAEGPGEQAAPAEWVPSEPYRDKIVPILSVLEGVRIGAARVSGPASKVREVKAVAQLETHFSEYLEMQDSGPRPGRRGQRARRPETLESPGGGTQMTITRNMSRITVLFVVWAFVLGIAIGPQPARSVDLSGALGDLVKIFGVGWVVSHFSGDIDHAINKLLAQKEAGGDRGADEGRPHHPSRVRRRNGCWRGPGHGARAAGEQGAGSR